MDLDQALQTFLAESFELLDAMEASLLSLGDDAAGGDRAEAVNAIFRAAHTMKGSAGLFGLDHVVAFTHVAESVLDAVRDGHLATSPALIGLLLSCCDHMRAMADEIAAGRTAPDPALEARGEPLVAALRGHLGTGVAARAAAPSAPGTHGVWHLSLRFGDGVLKNGMDPMSFIRYLSTVGTVERLATLADALPAAAAMDPECCYLGFEISLATDADRAAIESVFEFVQDDCVLRLLPPGSAVDDFIALAEALPEDTQRLAELLDGCGGLAAGALPRAIAARRPDAPPAPSAAEPRRAPTEQKPRENQTVRVDADKLDRLIDLVGELIIASAGAQLSARRFADTALHESHSALAALVQEVRDNALQLRMMRIGPTFQRFQRVVRDTAESLGKDITLVVRGEETELDKSVIEKIADPLTHLVRNAIDHGIDSPEQRVGRGKPPRGTITLDACHDAGQVVIRVADDGNGMDPARLRAKGIEKGLIAADDVLSDAELFQLVFAPGFSTAAAVTNLSGRGVGMDVVRRNIAALRGTVHIDSRLGTGTTVTVRLPLTLAIIDGFQVAVERSVFVVPLDLVEECIEYRPACSGGRELDYADLRGEVLPLIRLRQAFELGGTPGGRQNVVVLRNGEQKVGLVVDALIGEAQTVIKPLSKVFAHVKGISGSSIRANGDVVLILDVPALVGEARRSAPKAPRLAEADAPGVSP